jgi:dTDP-4-dehydrorhamnose reductase
MIWIIGNRGLLGQEFERLLRSAGLDCLGTGREVDLADPRALTAFHRDRIAGHGKPLDWVVNCAAYTAVDRAESEPELCQRINAEGPAVLADFARRHGCGILQLSSDYVFDGQGLPGADGRLRPYREDDPVNPVGVYGRSKAAGESAVRAGCGRHIILRTA